MLEDITWTQLNVTPQNSVVTEEADVWPHERGGWGMVNRFRNSTLCLTERHCVSFWNLHIFFFFPFLIFSSVSGAPAWEPAVGTSVRGSLRCLMQATAGSRLFRGSPTSAHLRHSATTAPQGQRIYETAKNPAWQWGIREKTVRNSNVNPKGRGGEGEGSALKQVCPRSLRRT